MTDNANQEVSAETEKGSTMTDENDLNTQVRTTADLAVRKLESLAGRLKEQESALEATRKEVATESEGLFRVVEMAEATLGVSLLSDALRSMAASKPQRTRQINENSLRESLIEVFENWGERQFTITEAHKAVVAAGYQFGGKKQSNYQRVYSEIKKLLDKGAIVKIDGDKRGVYSFVGLPAEESDAETVTTEGDETAE